MGAQARLRLAFVCFFASILLSTAPVAASSLSDGAVRSSTPSTSSISVAADAACSSSAVPRITGRVDDNVRASLQGAVHPLARAEYDQGKVDDNLPLEHMILMLQRTPAQEIALTTRIDQMHNRRSPSYHQWLRAQDVGACYGVADPDIAVVMGWLQKHGFKIDSVPAGKMLIIFSGTATGAGGVPDGNSQSKCARRDAHRQHECAADSGGADAGHHGCPLTPQFFLQAEYAPAGHREAGCKDREMATAGRRK